jgi:acetylglutamate kinase
VDAERLLRLLAAGVVPVVSPVSLGPDGAPVNVNADTAARAIAAALPADRLDLVTDVPGVRTSADAPGPVETLRASEADVLLRTPSIVRGGMHPKLQAAVAAVRAGVPSVRVGNLNSIRRGRSTEVVA